MKTRKHLLLFSILALCLSLFPLFGTKPVKAQMETTIMSHLDFGKDQYDGWYLRLTNCDYPDESNVNVDVNNTEISKLNFLDKIIIDGKPLSDYKDEITLMINRYTRWNSLYIKVDSITDVRNVESFTVLEGCEIPAYNYGMFSSDEYFVVSNEYYSGPLISKMETEVSDFMDYVRIDFDSFYVRLSNSDYPTAETGMATLYLRNDAPHIQDMNFWDHIIINGKPLKEYKNDLTMYLNLYQRWSTFGFKIPSLGDVRDIDSFEVLEGCEIPAYNNGAEMSKCLLVTKGYSYTKKVPQNIGKTNVVSIFDWGNFTYDGLFLRFADTLTGLGEGDEQVANVDATTLSAFEELDTLSHVFINGKSVKKYKEEGLLKLISLNYQTRWNSLYIEIDGIKDVKSDVTEFKIDEGTLLPVFEKGVATGDWIEIENEYSYKSYNDGSYPYEKDTLYGISSSNESYVLSQPSEYSVDGIDYLPLSATAKIYDEFEWDPFVSGVTYLFTTNASVVPVGTKILVEFTYPIDTNKFDIMYFKCLTTDSMIFNLYNYNDQVNPVSTFNTAHAFENRIIFLPPYADENGLVSKIVFETTKFANPQMFIEGFELLNHDDIKSEGMNLLDGALSVIDNEDKVEFQIAFNKAGAFKQLSSNEWFEMLKSHVLFNDIKLEDLKEDVTVNYFYNGFYNLSVIVDKDSTALRNKDNKYVSNSFRFLEGFEFPNEDTIDREYVVSYYDTYSLTENVMLNLEDMGTISIARINVVKLDRNHNTNISIYFSGAICGNNYYYATSSETFRATAVQSLNNRQEEYYNPLSSKNFVEAGYKRAILENILVNGKTIAEWYGIQGTFAKDSSIIIHYYGREQGNAMMISIDHNADFQSDFIASLEDGTATIEFLDGLFFPSGKKIISNYKYALSSNRVSRICVEELDVIYNGVSCADGVTYETYEETPLDSLLITNTDLYGYKHTYDEENKTYDIVIIEKATEAEIFSFKIKVNSYERAENSDVNQDKPKKCGMSLVSSIVPITMLLSVTVYAVIRRKEESLNA